MAASKALLIPKNVGSIEIPTIVAETRANAIAMLRRAGHADEELHLKEPDTLLNAPEQLVQNVAVQAWLYEAFPQNIPKPIAVVMTRDGQVILAVDQFIKGDTLEARYMAAQATGDQHLIIEYRGLVNDLVGLMARIHEKDKENEDGRYHGDPNPSNVKVSAGGILVLTDTDAHLTVEIGRRSDDYVMQTSVLPTLNSLPALFSA